MVRKVFGSLEVVREESHWFCIVVPGWTGGFTQGKLEDLGENPFGELDL